MVNFVIHVTYERDCHVIAKKKKKRSSNSARTKYSSSESHLLLSGDDHNDVATDDSHGFPYPPRLNARSRNGQQPILLVHNTKAGRRQ